MSFDLILPFLRPIESLLLDDGVSEIMGNPDGSWWFEKSGKLTRAGSVRFDAKALRTGLEIIANHLGKQFDESHPLLNVQLPDGSRLAAVLPPVVRPGPSLTIRKFAKVRYTLRDLIQRGALNEQMAEFLVAQIVDGKTLLISGGTSSGKTTLLNALADTIPEEERIVVIEDTSELRISKPNVLATECQVESLAGVVDFATLLKGALRWRPDRIILGEVRGEEARTLLDSFNTGHGGSLATIHANSPTKALRRFCELAMRSHQQSLRDDIAAEIADFYRRQGETASVSPYNPHPASLRPPLAGCAAGVQFLLLHLSLPSGREHFMRTGNRMVLSNGPRCQHIDEDMYLKAEPLSVGKVLSENHRFVVPIYQRTYAWTEKRQLEPLFAQIESKAQERLQNGKVEFPHYMGSLLVIPEGEATFGRIQAFDIVDGQQRLTTFHICYAAMRDVAKRWEFDDLYRKFESLLLHGSDEEIEEKYGRYKLQPTRFDRDLFRNLVDLTSEEIQTEYPSCFYQNGKFKKGPNPLAAYWFFRTKTEAFISIDENVARARFLALTDVIFQNFRFIVITLSKEDDPQVIFQTLNTGGEPLAAMDLVRNDVFLRAIRNGEDEEVLMKKYWHVFEDSFWKEEHTQGRIRKPLMDFFLAHVLGAETGELVSLSELYADYRKYAKQAAAANVAEELSALVRYAPLYRELIDPEKESPLYKLSQRMSVFDMSTAYPLILLIAASSSGDETKRQLYDLIGSYVIRRALCGLTAKNYNAVFLGIVSYMRKNGVSVGSFAEAVDLRKDSDSGRFPTDEEFREAITARGQYGALPTNRLRSLIEELELDSRDKFSASDAIRPGLSIEHIMPQNWQEHWSVLPSGRKAPALGAFPEDESMAQEIRDRNSLIHTLANLSLLTPPANASASNGDFDSKRPRLRDALLKMNLEIANEPKWTEQEIRNRASRLADIAVKLWPIPSVL